MATYYTASELSMRVLQYQEHLNYCVLVKRIYNLVDWKSVGCGGLAKKILFYKKTYFKHLKYANPENFKFYNQA